MDNALGLVQFGGKKPKAKPWEAADVVNVVYDHDGNTFRAIYTVRFREVVYVL
ncbi:hypothetical protein S101446_01751 [Komagataeibacter europaeus]|nr:hypothetical protein S101446_01751 [Komagataeibacter europaeus]